MISKCLLCGARLFPISPYRQKHPNIDTCLVRLTDEFGVSVDDLVVTLKPEDPEVDASDFFEDIDITVFPPVDEVLIKFFRAHGLDRLGGISSGHGWSMHSTFQRCAYLFYRKYRQPLAPTFGLRLDPPARAIGTLIHTFMAIYYQRMIVPDYPVTPQMCRDEILMVGNPDLIHEAWRCFSGYALFYQHEDIQPLAVEFGLRDPRTNESCRYDLIAYFPTGIEDRLPGTYVVEHKSAARFDDVTLDGWRNDGEVLGQIMLWDRLHLERRYGPLRGVMINIVGKQPKNQKFHRTIVGPDALKIDQHRSDLRINESRIQTADATGVYPRSRANCLTVYGKCDAYEHCAGEL